MSDDIGLSDSGELSVILAQEAMVSDRSNRLRHVDLDLLHCISRHGNAIESHPRSRASIVVRSHYHDPVGNSMRCHGTREGIPWHPGLSILLGRDRGWLPSRGHVHHVVLVQESRDRYGHVFS